MTRTKGNNPGKNVPGQESRAINHHVGPMKIEYVDDSGKRSQTLHKRRSTIFKKMGELSKLTKTEFICKWKTPSGSCGTFKSDGNGCTDTAGEVTTQDREDKENVQEEETVTVSVLHQEPSYPDPVVAPSNEDNESGLSGPDKTKCDICSKEHVGKKKNGVWLNCEYRKGCDYSILCALALL